MTLCILSANIMHRYGQGDSDMRRGNPGRGVIVDRTVRQCLLDDVQVIVAVQLHSDVK